MGGICHVFHNPAAVGDALIERKKLKEMKNGERISSYGLLILQSLRNDHAILALPADDEHTRRGKERTAKDIEGTTVSNEDGKTSAGKLMNNQTDRSIGYLPEAQKAKDTHELFAVPDNFQNMDAMRYVDSIGRFVRTAGPVAKYVADKRRNKYSRRMLAQTLFKPSAFGSPSTIGPQPTYTENLNSSSVSRNSESSRVSEEFQFTSCELHTDELWNELSRIGNMGSGSEQEVEPELELTAFPRGNNSSTTRPIIPDLNLMQDDSQPSNEWH